VSYRIATTNAAVICCLQLLVSLPSIAAETSTNTPSTSHGELDVLDQYTGGQLKTGHIRFGSVSGSLDDYFAAKEDFNKNTGFTYMLEIAPQFQWDGKGNSDNHANNETNLIMRYAPVDPTNIKRGNILVWYQWANTWGGSTTTDFSTELGILSPPNGGDTAPGKRRNLAQLIAWEQYFADDSVRIMAGKLTTRVLFNLNRYAEGDRADFFSPMLVNNPATHYTARVGAGFFAEYKQEDWYVSAMIRDADADLSKKLIDIDSLDSGNWEYVSEAALTPSNLFGWGKGVYRTTISNSNSTEQLQSTQTIALSFDQDIGENYGLFLRYTQADDTFRAFDKRLAAGIQFKNPLGFSHDRIGLGIWQADPTDNTLDTETGIDSFWKIQVTPFMEVSPGLQYIFDPALKPKRSHAIIAQLRLRLLF
jgi:hypothetical protein